MSRRRQKLLNLLFNAGVVVSIGATVLALGMSYRVAELLAPLRRVWLVVLMVIVNAVLVPAAAYGIGKALPIKSDAVVGLTLAAIGAASAAGLKASQLARRSDLALAVSIVVVLQLVNLVAVPLWAGAVVSGASISASTILADLSLLVLAPLAIGLVIRARYADHAKTWPTELGKISNLALAIALVAGISVNWHAIVSLLGSWVLLASVLTAIVGVGLGALVGHSDAETRNTTGLVSGLRFGSLGLIIIGTQLNGNSAYLGPAIVFSLIDLIVVLFLAVEIGRHTGPATAPPPLNRNRAWRGRHRKSNGTAPKPTPTRARPVGDSDLIPVTLPRSSDRDSSIRRRDHPPAQATCWQSPIATTAPSTNHRPRHQRHVLGGSLLLRPDRARERQPGRGDPVGTHTGVSPRNASLRRVKDAYPQCGGPKPRHVHDVRPLHRGAAKALDAVKPSQIAAAKLAAFESSTSEVRVAEITSAEAH